MHIDVTHSLTPFYLDSLFGESRMNRGLKTPRSPDLNPWLLYLWAVTNYNVHVNKPDTEYYLKENTHNRVFSLTSGIWTCNEQRVYNVWWTSVSRRKTVQSPALNIVTRITILTANMWTKTHWPLLASDWNKSYGYATCHHAKRTEWSVIQFVTCWAFQTLDAQIYRAPPLYHC